MIKYLINALIVLLCLSSCGTSQPSLHLFCWAEYFKPSLIEAFERQYGCKVIIDTFDSNESMYAKLKAGSGGYDIVIPSHYYVALMEQQQLLQPLDLNKLPNLTHLDRHHPVLASQQALNISVPYTINYTGIGFHTSKFAIQESSWILFGDDKYPRRLTMLNDPREVLGAALKYLGYSVNTIAASEIQEATNLVLAWRNNLAKFDSEQYKNGIGSGEYLLVQGFCGDIIQVARDNPEIAFQIPAEGTMIACDHFVILKGSQQADLAHSFINYLYDPHVAAENMEHTCYLCPNSTAYPLLSSGLRNHPGLFPSQELLARSESLIDLGENNHLYNTAWDQIKSSSSR